MRELSKVTDNLGHRIDELETHTVRMSRYCAVLYCTALYCTVQVFALQRLLTSDWAHHYHGHHRSGSLLLASVPPGLFRGYYGGHGVEVVHVQDGQGVKVTGDRNVPCNEISFRVTQGDPVHIPLEEQATTEAVIRATTEDYIQSS